MSSPAVTTSNTSSGKSRRRRRLDDEGEDEVLSADLTNQDTPSRPSECESEGEGPEPDELSLSPASELSEYESAHDQEDETEEGSDTETETGSESGSDSETETEGGDVYSEEEEGLEQERQSGDGEEQPDNEKPDDDEDKKNPAYVPRRGAFYEHDFRQGDEGSEVAEQEPPAEPAKPTKKLWQEDGKWAHDRYIDDLQAPKSREELIAIYGYDIRAADKPPETPPMKPSRGRGGRRDRKFQDFMPRMAVIDTTEGGADTVPNLDGEDFIPYNNNSNRSGRGGRGRRGAGRGGGRGDGRRNNLDSENFNNSRNRQEGSGRFSNGPRQDTKNIDSGAGYHNDEFPSLQESNVPSQSYDRNESKKAGGYDNLRRDNQRSADGSRSQRTDSKDIRGGSETHKRRGGHSDGGDSRNPNYSQQDARYDDRNWRSGPQDYRQDRSARGGGGGNKGFDRQENWRSSHQETRGNFNKSDSYSRREPREQRFDSNRGGRVGNAGDYTSNKGPGKYGMQGQGRDRIHQQSGPPPRFQQRERQVQEFTNTSYKGGDDGQLVQQANPPPSTSAPMDSGNTRVVHDNRSTDLSKNVVVSSSHDKGQREKVQTINVTITSTTTEKKSYAKERRAKGAALTDNAVDPKQVALAQMTSQSGHYQQQRSGGDHNLDASGGSAAHNKRYSSQRQQTMANRPFTEPPPQPPQAQPPADTKLYNPALPPPPFFPRDQTSVASAITAPPSVQQQPPLRPPPATAVAVPESAHFTPAIIPAASVPLQYPLPVSNAGLALPPSAAGAGAVVSNMNAAALLQQQQQQHQVAAAAVAAAAASQGAAPTAPGQAPAGTPILAPPFPLAAAGMMYSGTARVPGQAPPFPLPAMAYTAPPPPPQPAVTPAAPQGAQSPQQPQHKVYRGDITYYSPEMQQQLPQRVQQKRPKAAIPIIDPQVVRAQRLREKEERIASQRQQVESNVSDTKTVPMEPRPLQIQSEATSGGIGEERDFTAMQSDSPFQEPSQVLVGSPRKDSETALVVKGEASSIAEETAPVAPPQQSEPQNQKEIIIGQDLMSGGSEVKSSLNINSSDAECQEKSNLQGSVSIVAVDSRKPLTIVQSFNDVAEVVEKTLEPADVKPEIVDSSVSGVEKHLSNVETTDNTQQSTSSSTATTVES